jgi:hypothetical protein
VVIGAQSKAKIDEAKNAQKMQHNQQKFVADQKRRNVQTVADIQRQGAMTEAQVQATDLTTAANIRSKAKQSESETSE